MHERTLASMCLYVEMYVCIDFVLFLAYLSSQPFSMHGFIKDCLSSGNSNSLYSPTTRALRGYVL